MLKSKISGAINRKEYLSNNKYNKILRILIKTLKNLNGKNGKNTKVILIEM